MLFYKFLGGVDSSMALHLRLPKKEEDGSWWKTTKDGKVNRSPGYRFEVRVQSLAPIRRERSKAF